jgi:hypothetical protein
VLIPLIVVGVWASLALLTLTHVLSSDEESLPTPLLMGVPLHEQLGTSRRSGEDISEVELVLEVSSEVDCELELVLHSRVAARSVTLGIADVGRATDETVVAAEPSCADPSAGCATARAILRRRLAAGRYTVLVSRTAASDRRIPFTVVARAR